MIMATSSSSYSERMSATINFNSFSSGPNITDKLSVFNQLPLLICGFESLFNCSSNYVERNRNLLLLVEHNLKLRE